MAGAKRKGTAAGQAKLTGFGFKKKKNSKQSSDTEDTEASETTYTAVENDADGDAPESDEEKAAQGKSDKKTPPDQSSLPPISDIGDIFTDMVTGRPQLLGVVEPLKGRKLRIATMCSGTESPLLALDLIRSAMKEKLGATFDLEHVFSCEIEPYKQAYIERNFHPPIIFRDVCELGGAEATTVYGSQVPVPGNVDLLVAGTSCVDYSNLNNEKQDIDGKGESGKTFHGMLDWVSNHRPPMVILENVCSAPWDRVKEKFEQIDYSAEWLRVDTKQYYIPHTRTRVYLFAIDERKSSIPNKWLQLVKDMARPASASLDAFLLPGDDPRVTTVLAKLARDGSNADRRAGHIDWGKCENRHHRARTEEDLGNKRPLTAWETGGSCKILDFGWSPWAVQQVERVWDLMDISLLRSAYKGVDPSYKTLVWNLSQNVDRTIGSGRLGIAPCLTPTMIPYVTNRGGPITGLEALSLQGLPVNNILFTRETEDQLADLAGNAMSTTVVGACMIAALLVGKHFLKKEATGETTTGEAMDVDTTVEDGLETHITGEEHLVERELDLAVTDIHAMAHLLENAHRSRRLCSCEGRTGMTSQPLQECLNCGATSCTACGGRPEHNYQAIDLILNPRLAPIDFAHELTSALPMCLAISGIQDALNAARDVIRVAQNTDVGFKDRLSSWSQALEKASVHDLHFAGLKRQQLWTAQFNSTHANLELVLHPTHPEWRMFGKPPAETAANSPLRKLLANPVARLRCNDSFFNGTWEVALPRRTAFKVHVKGEGELVDSWERQLGLLGKDVKDKRIWSQLRVTVPEEGLEVLDRDISGLYTLHEKCGTAANSLHRRVQEGGEQVKPDLFFFLDPTRTGDAIEDSFVFSATHRRYEFGETRPILAKLDPKWRQSSVDEVQKVECIVFCHWVKSPAISLNASAGARAHISSPRTALEASASACEHANAILVCRVPLSAAAGSEWGKDLWKEVDNVHERIVFQNLSWCLERVSNLDGHPKAWIPVGLDASGKCECERCAPRPPTVSWTKVGKKIKGIEDPGEAGRYEQALKRRPAAFVTQLKHESATGAGIVRIGVNAVSLVHRASARLPSLERERSQELAYFIDTNYIPSVRIDLPKFVLRSNKLDIMHKQPPNFKLGLRPEQLRSLTWMISSEDPSYVDRQTFIEEEIAEGVLAPLGWRVQGRAQRPNAVYGGVLADAVGYGKTAITLGLIDCVAAETNVDTKVNVPGAIKVKATLVIVPPHLTRQWNSEIGKFTGSTYNTIVVTTVSNLNRLTVKAVKEADIIVVASNIFKSNIYLENLQSFSAGGSLPPAEGRHFNARLEQIATNRAEQVERLKANDIAGVLATLRKAKVHEAEMKRKHEEAAQSKRLKGKQYREAQDAKTATKRAKPGKNGKNPVLRAPDPNLIMEVVIPVSSKSPSSRSSPSTSNTSDTATSARTRRAATKTKSVVISDDDEDDAKTSEASDYQDEESEVEHKPVKKRSAPTRARGRVIESDDSAESTAEETSDEEEAIAVPIRSTKKKPVRKPKAGSTSASSDVEMIDESDSIHAPSKKRKSTGSARKTDDDEADEEDEEDEEDAPAKKKAKVTKPKAKTSTKSSTDRMEDKLANLKEWQSMPAPPFELFHFHRVVLDEYTYVDGKTLSMVTGLKATHRWVLSGTPPIHDFASVKSIAAHLDVHLGVDDDGEGQSAQAKKRRREQTDVERFHAFREVRTLEWHAHRHDTAQRFLDQFVRQNIAEIDEIPWETHDVIVDLPAAERAIYLELEHQLAAQEMTVKRTKKSESDREKRLSVMIGESNSAEEALLKRAATFDLEEIVKDTAMTTCQRIVNNRADQQNECIEDLKDKMQKAVDLKNKIGKAEEEYLAEFLSFLHGKGYGDSEADDIARQCWDDVSGGKWSKKPTKDQPAAESKAKAKVKAKAKAKGKAKDSGNAQSDLVWELREHTHDMRRVIKELTGRVRSHRYFAAVRDVQRAGDELAVACPACGRTGLGMSEVALLSSCGHMGCRACVRSLADKEECVYAASGKCKDSARVSNIVPADSLGADDNVHSGKHFGRKLEMIVDHIKNVIPKEERVLVFVQFPDLTKKVAAAFTEHKLKFLEIKGSASMKSKNLEQFQAEDAKERVLLLNVMDESASGANLTCASHAIFVSPLLAPSQEIYEACETQAIGRVRRYGQNKKVHIWRFLTRNTKDIEIYEQRSGLKVV